MKIAHFSTYPPYILEANVSDKIESLPSSRTNHRALHVFHQYRELRCAIFELTSAAQVKHEISFQLLPHFCILQIMLDMLLYIGTYFCFLS